ncbi:hypothetical protein [Marinactinospora rubrisoli]|uniref:Lipoprotein n=1 Tax=Marinactinospora rubrisoli TaxID=2715399 RepID=A0ABW2KJT7_9ACTN
MAAADASRRRSSSVVVIGAVGALSLAVAGCSGQDDRSVTAYCVDRDERNSSGAYQVVDEDRCDHRDSDSGGSGGGYYGGYHYYYGGTPRSGYVSGGSLTRPRDVTIQTQRGVTIQRGGAGGRDGSGGIGG